MSSEARFGGDGDRDPLESVPAECYDVFRHPRRLRILEILGTRRRRLSLSEMTTAIVDDEHVDVPNGQARHEVRTSLVHNHLPRLAERDIVDWDDESGVELVDDPPVDPADLSGLLELCDGKNGHQLLAALVHPVRMRLFSILQECDRPLSVDQLASKLVACDVDVPADSERVTISLYHAHLPKLEDAGVLELDRESGLVTGPDRTTPIGSF